MCLKQCGKQEYFHAVKHFTSDKKFMELKRIINI